MSRIGGKVTLEKIQRRKRKELFGQREDRIEIL